MIKAKQTRNSKEDGRETDKISKQKKEGEQRSSISSLSGEPGLKHIIRPDGSGPDKMSSDSMGSEYHRSIGITEWFVKNRKNNEILRVCKTNSVKHKGRKTRHHDVLISLEVRRNPP